MRTIMLVLTLVACNSSKGTVDAPPGGGDAAHDAAKVFLDAPAAGVCAGHPYDACKPTASNCMTGSVCKTFTMSGFSVCAPTCNSTTPCPTQNGTAVACNGMGFCKPPAPNSGCTAPP